MAKSKSALIDEIVDDDPDTIAIGEPQKETAPIRQDYPFYWRLYFTERKDREGKPLHLPKHLREMRVPGHAAPGPADAKRIYAKEAGRGYTVTELNKLGLTAVALQASPETIKEYPWGWLIKHPSFGSLRVRTEEAANQDEAKEVYCTKKALGMTLKHLEETGLRVNVMRFRPADTEAGK